MRHRLQLGRVSTTMVALAALSAANCAPNVDGPGGTVPVVATTRQMAATVDGAAWTTTTASVGYDATYMHVFATFTQGGKSEELTVAFHRTGAGDQVLDGVVGGWFGELRSVASLGLWMTGHGGAKGIVTLTTLTANRATGTFSFDAAAVPFSMSSPAMRHVTSGSFDLTF